MGGELIGLFQPPAPARRDFPAFAISTTLHGLGIALTSYVLLHAPIIAQPRISRDYQVRRLDFHAQPTPRSRAAEAFYPSNNSTPQPKVESPVRSGTDTGVTQTAHSEPRPRAVPALRLPEGGSGRQTLLQPQIHIQQLRAEIPPIPTVMIWTPPAKPMARIVPPAPDKPTTAQAQTSLQVPNEELQVADLPVTAANHPPKVATPPAGTTTPVAAPGPAAVHMPPTTLTDRSNQPTPAAVLSASDLKMDEGTVVLPPVNETRGTDRNDGAAAGQQGALGQQGGVPGSSTAAAGQAKSPAAAASSAQPGTVVGDAQKTAPNQFATGETAEHIQRPRDGKFNVIVVGSSLADQYPETLQVWSDRVAYTAYLHVGTPKAWILQYAQLRSADAATGGSVAHLDAPWPYDIMRPNLLSRDLNADALMIRGVLNETGRLEKLAIAYPQGYTHAAFVLHELAQWQFRPARQDGKPAAVEVLLIIPDNPE